MTTNPLKGVRETTTQLRARLQKLDRDLRALGRDQSIRPDIRQQRQAKLRRDAEQEVTNLARGVQGQLQQAARDNAPRSAALDVHDAYAPAHAARRGLYSQRAQGMLAAGDLHGIRRDIRSALRNGDRELAQEYLAVAGNKLRTEFGARELSTLQRAAVDHDNRQRASIHEALTERANDGVSLGWLQHYVQTALSRAGAGDPYDEPDPTFGRQIDLWADRMDETAGEAVERVADSFDAADAAVAESD